MKPLNHRLLRDEHFRNSEVTIEEASSWACRPQTSAWLFSSGLLDEVRRSCGAFEWVTFMYLAWLGAIFVICHRNIEHAPRYIAVHSVIALGILWLAVAAHRSQNKFTRFARHWYPLPLYIFFLKSCKVSST
jgi:hypothetical protein